MNTSKKISIQGGEKRKIGGADEKGREELRQEEKERRERIDERKEGERKSEISSAIVLKCPGTS